MHVNTVCAAQFVFVRSVLCVLREFQSVFHHVVSELLASEVDHDIGVE